MAEEWNPPPFGDISSDELVTAAYLNQLGNSLRFLKEVNYTQFISDVAVTATAEATPTDIVSSGSITYEAVPHLIEFFCGDVLVPTAGLFTVSLWDGATNLGWWGRFNAPSAQRAPWHLQRRETPTAAAHEYKVRGFLGAAGTVTLAAAAGGAAGDNMPGFIRITRIPT